MQAECRVGEIERATGPGALAKRPGGRQLDRSAVSLQRSEIGLITIAIGGEVRDLTRQREFKRRQHAGLTHAVSAVNQNNLGIERHHNLSA